MINARRHGGGGAAPARAPCARAAATAPPRRWRLNPAARGRGADETAPARGGTGGRRPTVCLPTIGAAPSVREGDDRYTEAVRVPAGYQVARYSCVIPCVELWRPHELFVHTAISLLPASPFPANSVQPSRCCRSPTVFAALLAGESLACNPTQYCFAGMGAVRYDRSTVVSAIVSFRVTISADLPVLWDITSLGSVGFFDVAARLCAGDGPIAALVGGASCSIGSALQHRIHLMTTKVVSLYRLLRRKIRRRCPISFAKAEKNVISTVTP